ncbi:hypothetical protein DFJ63DRAFT_212131 [Scheffersomyces coipomensis]|uniref:uncharacterized protein n=1 Tax=Scheffersomyces coipomensis TaxID=1788519 RepID=UPI00315D17B9
MSAASSCSMFKNSPSSKILKQIYRLNLIAGNPENAYKLNPEKYSKIELFLIQKNVHAQSVGLKKFWKDFLPTLKFHNDDIDFIMTRIKVNNKAEAAACPAKILVHGKDQKDNVEIDCANLHSSKILRQLVTKTGAVNIPLEEIPRIRDPNEQKPEWIS